MASDVGRIHENIFKEKGMSGTLFGLSIITATSRTVIRIRSQGRLVPDDFMLILACVCLIGSHAILYTMLSMIYLTEPFILDPGPAALALVTAPGFFDRIVWYRKLHSAYSTLTWTTLYAVKFCFLLFFRQLVDRQPRFFLLWKMVFGITALFYLVCICSVFMSCPHFDISFIKCWQSSGLIAFNFTLVALDITTDLLTLAIPVLVLWKVKIKLRQKLLLGVFLCLSICMVVIAIVRVSGMRIGPRTLDVQWQGFWQNVEANVAVITVSITAFRSMLGMRASEVRREKRRKSWYCSYRQKLRYGLRLGKDPYHNVSEDIDQLPSIPGATLTGMRTYMHGDRKSKSTALGTRDNDRMGNLSDDWMESEQHGGMMVNELEREGESVQKDGNDASAENLV